MKALNLDKLDAFMEIEYDGEIYNAYTKNDIDDKAINAIPLDKVKQARNEIKNIKKLDFLDTVGLLSSNNDEFETSKKFAIAILDKLIAESELVRNGK